MKAILCIDTAANSGWCISVDGQYHSSGETHAFGVGPDEVVGWVLELDRKATMILEQPSHGNRASLVGMGAARGCWLAAWCKANKTKTPVRTKSCFPAKWRSQLFNSTGNFPLQEKLHAQIYSGCKTVGPDQAAAVCINSWANKHLTKGTVQ